MKKKRSENDQLTTDFSNFDFQKNSIFLRDSSVPIKKIAIKLPFKIQSPNCQIIAKSVNWSFSERFYFLFFSSPQPLI